MLAEIITLAGQTNPFEYLPGDGWGRIVGILLILLLGWQGKGFIQAFREDKRKSQSDEVDLLEEVKKITFTELKALADELSKERQERQKLGRRVSQLERILVSNGIPIPPEV